VASPNVDRALECQDGFSLGTIGIFENISTDPITGAYSAPQGSILYSHDGIWRATSNSAGDWNRIYPTPIIQARKTDEQDLNANPSGVVITWQNEEQSDSLFYNLVNNTDFTILTSGKYKISYQINTDGEGNNRHVVKTHVELNSLQIDQTIAYSYRRSIVHDFSSNTLPE
jgi:hypothetical protein